MGVDKNYLVRMSLVDDEWIEFDDHFIKFVECYRPSYLNYQHGIKIHIKSKQDNKSSEELPVSILRIEAKSVKINLTKSIKPK